jgi:hypothetical protein
LTFFSAILLVSNQNNPFSNQLGSTPCTMKRQSEWQNCQMPLTWKLLIFHIWCLILYIHLMLHIYVWELFDKILISKFGNSKFGKYPGRFQDLYFCWHHLATVHIWTRKNIGITIIYFWNQTDSRNIWW